MKPIFSSFNYFAGSLHDPLWEVFSVLDDNNHAEHEKLKVDLASIEIPLLESFLANNNIDHLINTSGDIDQQKRAYFYINYLHQNIYSTRIEKLLDTTERPSPYNKKNLLEIGIDKHNLCIINQFRLDNFCIQKDDFVYQICPILEQSNSSYWLFRQISYLASKEEIILKIRLDPFIEIAAQNYHPVLYKMIVFGKPLNWARLFSLREDEFGQWFDEKEYNRYGITDYLWSPIKNEIHFTCEELPKISYNGLKTSRYFHTIFNRKNGNIKHCDGAIRLYSDDELITRSKYHIKDPSIRKFGKRIKIFQFDSTINNNSEINRKIFCDLITAFFVWNRDIMRYFS